MNGRMMTGKEFMDEFVTTSSGYLEHVLLQYPEDEIEDLDMGNMLGDGFYLCVSDDESDHYQSDDYAIGVEYYSFKNNAVIYIESGCRNKSSLFFRKASKKYDALYDTQEENLGDNDYKLYLGVVVYNENCLEMK